MVRRRLHVRHRDADHALRVADELECVNRVREPGHLTEGLRSALARWLAPLRELSGIVQEQQVHGRMVHLALGRKFRRARCAEIDLGRRYGIWVPWVTPMTRPAAGWMATGFDVHDAMREHGFEAIEVYPHAGYRRLVSPERLPSKTGLEGSRVRVAALRRAGVVVPDDICMWSHDGFDALVAALIARDRAAGVAVAATCGNDGSAIWLPRSGAAA